MLASRSKRLQAAASKVVLLSPQKMAGVISKPVIDFVFYDAPCDFSLYDFVIFTSKTGVRSVLGDGARLDLACFAVGEQTADFLRKLGARVEFTGTSYGKDLRQEIQARADKKFLLISPKRAAADLRLANVTRLITYETVCKDVLFDLTEETAFIFTSPSCVECFFKNNAWRENYRAIAIGKTTKEAFAGRCAEVFMPPRPSIEACISTAREILKDPTRAKSLGARARS